MNSDFQIVDSLQKEQTISLEDFHFLLETQDNELIEYLAAYARKTTTAIYDNHIYIRGLIEFTNICKNDCFYCGIRKSNTNAQRYRLTKDDILACCKTGYALGFRTFVLQGGEDAYFTDTLVCDIVSSIKKQHSDCAITLSIGEKTRDSYQKYFDAGTDRYLLRHETANEAHYQSLHPSELSFRNRMRCLRDLKAIGYQTGCGFMVGSPHQTLETLYEDIRFIQQFHPEMVGIGPFIPHKDTPFANKNAGTLEQTLRLLSIIRLLHPHVLLPATTALGTIHPQGREMGILHGANVVMPNLSPTQVREKYMLYNDKISTGVESAEGLEDLKHRMERIGYQVVMMRGDYK